MSIIDTTASDSKVSNAQEAAEMAADACVRAKENGTFGVGAILVENSTGKVLAISLNEVLSDGKVKDPTGHAERQIIDWYYEQTNSLGRSFPKPNELTIVSSLDPCMMCCGASLTANFNVVSMTYDKFAGVSGVGDGNFSALPNELKLQAKRLLSYFAIKDKRDFSGTNDALFATDVITPEVEKRAVDAFYSSFDNTHKIVSASEGVAVDGLLNPATLPADHPVINALRHFDTDAVTVKTSYEKPDKEIMPALLKNANAAKSAGNTFNAVSIVDRFGNVLMTMVGNEGKSPIRTALMELTRAYASVREQAGADDLRYLPHPKYLKFVSLVGSGKDGVSVMDLGAYGSTVHGEIPKSNSIPFQYIIPKQDPNELDKMVSKFPPLYSDAIKIAPKQVEDIELKRLGEKAAFQMSGV